jgi:hypothetical protein
MTGKEWQLQSHKKRIKYDLSSYKKIAFENLDGLLKNTLSIRKLKQKRK